MINHIGEIYKTNGSCNIEIIGYNNACDVQYKFLDDHGFVGSTTIRNIRCGQVRNPYQKDSFGGYNGVGKYNGKEYDFVRSRWRNMIIRANSDKSIYKNYRGDVEYYQNTLVCDEWMCYNIFAEWFINITKSLNKEIKYDIDKDLLYPFYKTQTNGLKLYSPSTVVILPHKINVLLEGNSIQRNLKSRSMQEWSNTIKGASNYYYILNAMHQYTYDIIKNMDFEWFFIQSNILDPMKAFGVDK